MKEIILDGRLADGMEDIHRCFCEGLELPEYYGFNLDALHDVLTDLHEDVTVVIRERSQLSLALGKRYGRLMRMLEDAAEENEHLILKK